MQTFLARGHAPRLLVAPWRWLLGQPWLLLCLMALLAGANGVAARLADNQVPPLVLVFLRWFIVCATLSAMLRREDWRELRRLVRGHWVQFAWMGLLGYAGFNALFYTAAYSTSAVNLTLLQSATPALVLVGAATIFGMRIGPWQVAGMVLTFVGVLVVAAKGHLESLAAFRLGSGDAYVLLAALCYACYTLGLRGRPPGSALVFFAGMAGASLLWSLPLAGAEIVGGHAYWPSLTGWLVTLFIAFGPSFIGQLCYMRGVDLIGPARAGLASNMVPVTGALCAVAVLGEAFTSADMVAVVLTLGGISLAEWSGPRRRGVSRQQCAGPARDAGLP